VGYLEQNPVTSRKSLVVVVAVCFLLSVAFLLGYHHRQLVCDRHTNGWNSMPSFVNFISKALQGKGFGPMHLETVGQLPYSAVWILFLVAAPIMLKFLFDMDRWLWLYSAVFLIPVLAGGALLSLPRFISFIFLWLAVELKAFKREKTKYILPLIAILSLVVGMLLWSAFIQGEFIA
jgi:hypothetical protein